MRTKTLSKLPCYLISFFALRLTAADVVQEQNASGRDVNAFTYALYSRLSTQEGNVLLSPLIVHTALAMAYCGARGETAAQMAKVLNLSDGTRVDSGRLLSKLNRLDRFGNGITMANALFAQRGYRFVTRFKEDLIQKFSCNLNEVDLTGWPGAFDPAIAASARRQINSWVARETHNKIEEIVPQTLPSSSTRLILASAIWFKGKWAYPFDKSLTQDAVFRCSSKRSVQIPTMHIITELACAQNETGQLFELPYASNHFSMLVLLPKPDHSLGELESHMDTSFGELIAKLHVRNVRLSLPRFRSSSHLELNKTLLQMGIREAFLPDRADFSGIASEKPLFLEAVLQKAHIAVDEEGTEASAGVEVAVSESIPLTIEVNRPFLLLIRDNQTGVVLFIGRIQDPTKE